MRFENNEMGNDLLLGDSGYPNRSYIITPLNNPLKQGENIFNESQIRSRNVVERTFGIWKRRFPVLSIGRRCNITLVQQMIIATAILHNICRQNNSPELDDDNYEDGEVNETLNLAQNDSVRRNLIDYFSSL